MTQWTKAHLTVVCLCLYDPYHSLPFPSSTWNFRSLEEEVTSKGSMSGYIWLSTFQVVQPSRGTDWSKKENSWQSFSFSGLGVCVSLVPVIPLHCTYACCKRTTVVPEFVCLFVCLSVTDIMSFMLSLAPPSPRWQWLPNVPKSHISPLLPICHLSSFVHPASSPSMLNSFTLNFHIVFSVL